MGNGERQARSKGEGVTSGPRWRRAVPLVAVVAVVAALVFVAAVSRPGRADGAGTVILFSFESEAELRAWQLRQATGELSPLHATDGHRSLKVDFQVNARGWPGMYLVAGKGWSGGNWARHQTLELDVFNPQPQPVDLTIAVFDTPNRKGGRAKRWPASSKRSPPRRGYRSFSCSRRALCAWAHSPRAWRSRRAPSPSTFGSCAT